MTTAAAPATPVRTPGEVVRTYLRVPGANVLLFEPAEPGPEADVLVTSMHGGLSATLEHRFLEQLARLGFRSAYCVPDSSSFVEQLATMDRCLRLLRTVGSSSVVLMGQSRGAALMSAYQKIAENGPGVFQGPERRLPLPDLDLEPADGLMLLDANFGFMVMHVMSMNPALVTEGDALVLDPSLDALDPRNGYAPDGRCAYPEEFRRRFLTAQRARYRALLEQAEERWRLIQAGGGRFADNEPFVVPDAIGTNNSPKLFAGDLRLFSRTRHAWPLIHPDGSVTTEVVPCLRVDENNPAVAGTLGAAWRTTVKDFLWLEVEVAEDYDYGPDHLDGVGFASSMTCSTGNVEMIGCPLLLMGHTAGYEFIAAEWSYLAAASEDKTIAFTEGATHGWLSIDTARYGDTLATEAAYVAGWLSAPGRFGAGEGMDDAAVVPDAALPADRLARLGPDLVGRWCDGSGAVAATFHPSGSTELAFDRTLTHHQVDADGTLRLGDRYGSGLELRPVADEELAAQQRGTYFVDDRVLVIETRRLVRQPAGVTP